MAQPVRIFLNGANSHRRYNAARSPERPIDEELLLRVIASDTAVKDGGGASVARGKRRQALLVGLMARWHMLPDANVSIQGEILCCDRGKKT